MHRHLLLVLPAIALSGCLSFSSTSHPNTDLANTCSGRQDECRRQCEGLGVQTYSCTANSNEGVITRCECRKPGTAL